MVANAFNPSTWQAYRPLGISTTFHGRPHAQEQLVDQHQMDSILLYVCILFWGWGAWHFFFSFKVLFFDFCYFFEREITWNGVGKEVEGCMRN